MITNPDPHQFYTVPQACELTHTREQTMWLWIRTGRVPAVRLGKSYLIPSSALAALAERAHTEAAERARATQEQERRAEVPA